MNNRYKRLCVVLIFIFVFNLGTLSYAMTTGFEIEEIENCDKEEFLAAYAIELIDREIPTKGIWCFDVNEYGDVALAFDDFGSQKIILVYNEKNEFVYGYKFRTYGVYGVEWDSKELIIHISRSYESFSLDNTGQCIEIVNRMPTSENSIYWSKTIQAKEKYVGKEKYFLTNNNSVVDFLSPTYGQLIRVDEEGNENILYDDGGTVKQKIVLIVICIVLIVIAFYGILINILMQELKRDNSQIHKRIRNDIKMNNSKK